VATVWFGFPFFFFFFAVLFFFRFSNSVSNFSVLPHRSLLMPFSAFHASLSPLLMLYSVLPIAFLLLP